MLWNRWNDILKQAMIKQSAINECTLGIYARLEFLNIFSSQTVDCKCTKRLNIFSIHRSAMVELTKMQAFYREKSIFITGASGFMGKCLLEKLLYSCSDVKQIFILVRPKRGKSGAQRVQEFSTLAVSSSIFLPLCMSNAMTFAKLWSVANELRVI